MTTRDYSSKDKFEKEKKTQKEYEFLFINTKINEGSSQQTILLIIFNSFSFNFTFL